MIINIGPSICKNDETHEIQVSTKGEMLVKRGMRILGILVLLSFYRSPLQPWLSPPHLTSLSLSLSLTLTHTHTRHTTVVLSLRAEIREGCALMQQICCLHNKSVAWNTLQVEGRVVDGGISLCLFSAVLNKQCDA